MQKRIHIILPTYGLFALALPAFAQSPNANLAAVDTLTKYVALAVFEPINQPKAQEIYGQLLECSEGCDPRQIIRGVGGWDAVGAKMEELSLIRNTARFQAMPPAEANAAIRQQLTRFYDKYKADKNYGKPLSPDVQARILTKIDALLTPSVAAETPTPQERPEVGREYGADTTLSEGGDIDGTALHMSQLERQVNDEPKKRLWMMMVSAVVGLIVGAGAMYLLMVRALRAEVADLIDQNTRLSRAVDAAQRPKPVNAPRQPQGDYKQKADAYDAIRAELGSDPVAAIRQLKQQATAKPAPGTPPVVRSGVPKVGEAAVDPTPAAQPAAVPDQSPAAPVQAQEPAPAPARSEVFYVPPPDPNGQFDSAQKMPVLSPESAYRFSVSADRPDLATFRFEAEPGRVARFLTYRNYMIEPACDSENSYSSVHTRVVMRRDGEAVLENGAWRVKAKALIRYE